MRSRTITKKAAVPAGCVIKFKSVCVGLAQFVFPEFLGVLVVGEHFAKLGGVFKFVGDAGLALFDPVEEKLRGAAADARLVGVDVKGGDGGEVESGFLVSDGAEENPAASLDLYDGLKFLVELVGAGDFFGDGAVVDDLDGADAVLGGELDFKFQFQCPVFLFKNRAGPLAVGANAEQGAVGHK